VELIPYHLVYNDGWQIDLRSVDAALNSGARAILVVNPNNPTGSFVTPSELERLIDLCADHRLALISDEVFSDYAFAPDAPRRPGRSLRPRESGVEALTFTLSGLSKISALPQMKLAWLVVSGAPDRLKSALARLELIADTYLSVSGAVANALPRLLELRHSVQPQILARTRSNLQWLDERLLPQSNVSRLKSEGGWYAVLRLPSTRSDEDWAIELLRQDGVVIHPGHFYDFPSDHHMVSSLLPRPEVFQEGMTKIIDRAGK
jgi:aspartate/methionine/tyrosine aminotransferase